MSTVAEARLRQRYGETEPDRPRSSREESQFPNAVLIPLRGRLRGETGRARGSKKNRQTPGQARSLRRKKDSRARKHALTVGRDPVEVCREKSAKWNEILAQQKHNEREERRRQKEALERERRRREESSRRSSW